jgi:hypothetical protein
MPPRARPAAAIALAACALAAAASSASEPRIHLTARPATAESSAITRFRFVATRGTGTARRPVTGATVRFAGVRARTDSHGRAFIVRRLPTGHYRARACKAGFACGSVRVTVIPRVAAR